MTTISHDQYDKPINRKQWQSDSDSPNCNVCQIRIIASIFRSNKHHCRYCGKVVCGSCSINTSNATHVLAINIKHRICDLCHAKKKELKESMIKLSSHIPESVLQDSSDPIQISPNLHMFVSAPYRSDHDMYCYDAINDKWTKKLKQKINKHSPTSHDIVAFNKNTDEVYSISSKYSRFPVQLKKINIKRKTVKSIELSNDHKIREQVLKDAKCIVINDILHIIGGRQSNIHYILDETKCELVPQWSFGGDMLRGAGLVYLETKETLYLFGGIIKESHLFSSRSQDRYSNCVYKYYPSHSNMTKCVWKKLDVKMPSEFKTSDIVITSCKNDKYILLFDTGLFTQDIYIFDVDKEKFMKSLVKCPIGWAISDAKAFVPNNYTYKTHKMNTLLYGYFHATNTSYASYHISIDIINLISTFISFDGEFVHIFGGLLDNSTHWKININYILNNVKTNNEINLFGFLRALGGLRGILDSR